MLILLFIDSSKLQTLALHGLQSHLGLFLTISSVSRCLTSRCIRLKPAVLSNAVRAVFCKCVISDAANMTVTCQFLFSRMKLHFAALFLSNSHHFTGRFQEASISTRNLGGIKPRN
ncbi:hypothetical protein AB6A40_008966 [Gnathostoma spinigerum]|uniref:Secreted protein n=1 Tax=Gnathostoma spinigerum TaxID=75299 RepID=A0ABD6ESZ9_9BILA